MTGINLFSISFFSVLLLVYGQSSSKEAGDEFVEPFDIPLEELKKETTRTTTLTEQCQVYKEHYDYFCQRSNIAKYNEEVRILCERYDLLCRDRVPATIDHIRRQRFLWKAAGVPKAVEKKLVSCYTSCKETDPVCVNACECIFLGWIMEKECEPGVKSLSEYNCNRWFKKCRQFWAPLPNLTPYPFGVHSPPPIVRGVFFGYDGLGNSQVYNRPRDHGVSLWRGTNTVIVNWPEGKIGQATTWGVPAAGVEAVFNAWDVGFPSAATFFRDNFGPLTLNPGTGRVRRYN
ncbi:hypothetical protein FO519_000988 [Halicephalobus sp. NKZ332]|nr:hypothetical protein FO519_000988 [Halicephalobus sp. NKZ332]